MIELIYLEFNFIPFYLSLNIFLTVIISFTDYHQGKFLGPESPPVFDHPRFAIGKIRRRYFDQTPSSDIVTNSNLA